MAPRRGSDPRHRWIVDPLDGTTNFLHGIPHFAISIALERDGEIVAGLVYDPVRDEMYSAEKGLGAYVNDRRLRVSARRRLGDAVIGTGMPFGERGERPAYLATLAAVMTATSGVRRIGAAALDLAYVAAGRYEGFWEFALSPWDIAAGMLLVREAGGYVSDLSGGHAMMTSGDVLAANDHLHLPLAALIRDAMRTARAAASSRGAAPDLGHPTRRAAGVFVIICGKSGLRGGLGNVRRRSPAMVRQASPRPMIGRYGIPG